MYNSWCKPLFSRQNRIYRFYTFQPGRCQPPSDTQEDTKKRLTSLVTVIWSLIVGICQIATCIRESRYLIIMFYYPLFIIPNKSWFKYNLDFTKYQSTYPILSEVCRDQWRDEASSVSDSIRDSIQRPREVRRKILMIHEIRKGSCSVRAHGEGDEGDWEDRSAACVAQSYQEQTGHHVREQAEELPHEGGRNFVLFDNPGIKRDFFYFKCE